MGTRDLLLGMLHKQLIKVVRYKAVKCLISILVPTIYARFQFDPYSLVKSLETFLHKFDIHCSKENLQYNTTLKVTTMVFGDFSHEFVNV